MRARSCRLLAAWAVGAAVLAGCSSGQLVLPPASPSAAAPSASASAAAPSAPSDPVKLSPAQLAGQRVIYSYPGLTPPAGLLSVIRHGEAAGVIFFGDNISSRAQIAGVVSQLDRANASRANPLRRFPLLLMTDQEGGLVKRLPGAPSQSEEQIGDSADPAAAARSAGTGAGRTLRRAGLNVNLAPVVDVARSPDGFDDQDGRSYSGNPRVAAALGAEFIAGQQATGVAATAKHFPGLGAATASQDTDVRPATLNVPRAQLRRVDEYPFRAAIAAGVKLVMVSWAVYPALGSSRPAGLSPSIVDGELRGRLGFQGVTITDTLAAGALQAYGTMGHRATLAASAGMDLILCAGQSLSEGNEARTALQHGYTSHALAQTPFRAAVQRVATLRAGLTR